MIVTDSDRKWKRWIDEIHASGITYYNWCREHDVPESTFYYHLRRIRKLGTRIADEPVPAMSVRDDDAVRIEQDIVRIDIVDDTSTEAMPVPVDSKSEGLSLPANRSALKNEVLVRLEAHGVQAAIFRGADDREIHAVIDALRGC